MASIWRGGVDRGTEVDDFEEFDSTPYGGGYDIHMTYGRPLPPSEEICYPISSAIDYDRPSYSSGSKPSAYDSGNRYDDSENRFGGRPKPQPAYGFHPQAEEPNPEYGYGRPQENEYGRRPQPKPEYEYGGRQENEYGGSGFGGGHQENEYGGSYGYGGGPRREEEKPSYGYGGEKPERYGEEEKPSYGYGQERPKPYGEEGGEHGSGEYGYEKPSRYGGDEDTGSGYGEGYRRSGTDSDDNEERKHHHHGRHHRRNYDDE